MGACHNGDVERLYHIVFEAPDESKERKFYAEIWVHRLLNLKQLKKWSEWILVDDATKDNHEGDQGWGASILGKARLWFLSMAGKFRSNSKPSIPKSPRGAKTNIN
ncbi:hypothetical protein CCACVL1_09579, partial [Corchorus capsularis]